MLAQFDPTVLDAVRRASDRSAAVVHEEMKSGLYDLATIASIAAWIGIFGTIAGIANSFQGATGPRWAAIAGVCRGLSRAMSFSALGLLVGLVALWCFEYLSARLRNFDRDMENTTLELLDQLGRFPNRFTIDPRIEHRASGPMFGELPLNAVAREERDFRRCFVLAGIAVALQWLVQAIRFTPDYFVWFPAPLYACIVVPVTVAICCVFLYPLWSRFLNRKPGVLVAGGSVLALCWSVAEFALGRHLP